PTAIPSAPVVTVADNCGSSTLTATGTSLLWSTGETTASITVTTGATYTVTQTVAGCTSTNGSGTANPTAIPSAPTVTVADNCGSSTLTATGTNLLWSTVETTSSITVTTGGAYTVTQTVAGCTSTNGSGTANPTAIPSAPTVTVVDNCGSSTLTATGTNLLWSTGETTASITVTTGGAYTVTQTVAGCTSANGSGTANSTAIPSAPVVTVTDNCGSSTLTATGTNLLWSTGETTASITVTTGGAYTVTQIVAGCTSANGSGVANPLVIPAMPTITASGTLTFCAGGSVDLSSSQATGNVWSTGATTNLITASTSASYTVTYTNPSGCLAVSAATVVAVNPNPIISIGSFTDPITCASLTGSIVVSGTGTGLVAWSGTASGNSGAAVTLPYTITGLSAGSYNVNFVDGNTCVSNTLNQALTDPTPPANPTISASGPLTFCAGGSVDLTSSQATGNVWTTGETTQTITVSTSATYSVTYTNGSGCSASSTPVVVTVNALPSTPTVTVTDNCGSSLLSATGTNLLWSTGETTSSITVTTGGAYTVTQTVAGCTSTNGSGTANPTSIPASPVVTVADNCGSSALTATGTSLSWSTGETTSSITVTTGGAYTVTQTVTGCTSATGSGTANPTAIPTAPVVTVTDNCGSSTLTATGVNLLWSTGEATASITVTTGGAYTVTQTVGGCTSTTGSGVANPTAIPSAPVVTVADNCGSSTLTATGISLLWSTGETTGTITVTTGATYTVTQTVAGCTSTNGSGVANPTAIPSAPVVTVVDNCGSSTLTATGVNLLWSTAETTASITVTTGGVYTVTQTVAGCTSSNGSGTANPTAIPSAPVVTVVDNCGSSTLTATGINLSWSTGETTASVIVTTGGAYTVTQTVAGCTSVNGSGIANPAPGPAAPIVTVLNNCGSSTLSVTGTNLLWSTGETTSTITVTTGGSYTVTETIAGCTSAAGTGVANPTAIPSVPIVTVADNCGSSTLTATGSSLLWSTGETTASITVTTGATYTVTQTVAGCTSANGSGVANPTAIPSAPTITVADNCGSSTLTATGVSLLWSTGETTTSITVTTGATYTVTQTVAGCTSVNGSGTANPTAIPSAPTVTVADNCGSSTLTATGVSLLWSTGETTASITVTSGGAYTVTQTVAGCTSANGSGTANPTAIPSAPVLAVADNCGSSTLTATGVNLLWSTAETTASITVTTGGAYTVTQTVAGCTSVNGSGTANPTAIPSAPTVTVVDNCGSSTLTATGVNLLWSTGETTASITVTTGGAYTVIQTVAGCTSANGLGTANPTAIPAAPVVTVTDNCGSSILTATGVNLLWSTAEITPSITVTTGGVYTVTQTVAGCTSTNGSSTANPTAIPSLPGITVVDNCGSSTLTATGVNLLWSTGETTTTITVATAGTYTVTQTVAGCTSSSASGTVNPLVIPNVTWASSDTTCANYLVFNLTGGSPAGGAYSGNTVTGNTFNPGLAGIGTHVLTYTYTDVNGCSASATQNLVVDGCASIDEFSKENISVYPNPTFGIVKITSSGASIEAVRIFDATGRIVRDVVVSGQQSIELDMSDFSSGVYNIEVVGSQSIYRTRLVKN
ncbi:MAG: T9SS type A sorting domain-containing protein, partial [Fluviicola sp.]|nr:T9SS type A sorting domain-containing protein [Fluviicola sp.]